MGDDRYANRSSRETILGYYLPTPFEELSQGGRMHAFERAKAEAVKNLHAWANRIELMTYDQFATRSAA